jgi:hypothetical protein
MFNTTVYLYIVSFDLDKNEKCFVSTSEDRFVPLSTDLTEDNLSIDQYLEILFEQNISLGFGWVNTKLLDVIKQKENINIHYTCIIPPDTPIKNCYYTSANLAIINRFARKALLYV